LPLGDLQLPLAQYLCHDADANNGWAERTSAERRIRPKYAFAGANIGACVIAAAIRT
jgi:hypothetical protein